MIPTGKTRIAGVLGWPVAHSLSPPLHSYWLDRYGVDAAYLPFPVEPAALGVAVAGLRAIGVVGTSVTIPHKEAVLAHVDRPDDAARRLGAANTLVFDPDGTIHATNTDGFGFLANLEETWPRWTRDRVTSATVLGAGGAAKSIIDALAQAGLADLHLVNRTRARAENLAESLPHCPVTVHDWDNLGEILARTSLLVNTTSIGLDGQGHVPDLSPLPAGSAVADIVYAPLETPFLSVARARGLETIDGLGMLIHQARPAFARWFGIEPEATPELRRNLEERLSPSKPLT